jgi:phage FluMu protein Com
MPIRFRCRYCNQLMGIARRKAGMLVECPTCHAQVVVPPELEEKAAPPAAKPIPNAPAPLFERSDFDVFLHNPVAEKPPAHPDAPRPLSFAVDSPSSASFAPSSVRTSLRPPGLVLSPGQATWLTVAVILLVAVAFGAGLLVGHYLLG